jgi:hypothetical protein
MSTANAPDPGTLLLEDLEAFLRETGMGASTFGRKAMGNSAFVLKLRDGRNVYLATEAKVRAQMATFRRIGRFDDPRNQPTAPKLRRKAAQAHGLALALARTGARPAPPPTRRKAAQRARTP